MSRHIYLTDADLEALLLTEEQLPESLRMRLQAAVGEPDDREKAIIAMAEEQHARDGECEIDEDAVVSEGGDNGAYVMAWVWVSLAGTELDQNVEDTDDDEVIEEE